MFKNQSKGNIICGVDFCSWFHIVLWSQSCNPYVIGIGLFQPAAMERLLPLSSDDSLFEMMDCRPSSQRLGTVFSEKPSQKVLIAIDNHLVAEIDDDNIGLFSPVLIGSKQHLTGVSLFISASQKSWVAEGAEEDQVLAHVPKTVEAFVLVRGETGGWRCLRQYFCKELDNRGVVIAEVSSPRKAVVYFYSLAVSQMYAEEIVILDRSSEMVLNT